MLLSPTLKIQKKSTPRKFLINQELKIFNLKLKTSWVFYENPLGFFIIVSSDVFISTLIFTIVFGCFHCWLYLLSSWMFLQVFLFHHWFYNCFSSVFISPTFFAVTFFCQVLCFCLAVVASATDLREPFLNSGVFYLTLLPDFGTTYFYQSLPGPAVLLRRLQGLSLKFETLSRSIFLFERNSVQQKVLVGRFYLCIRSCYRLLY